METKFLHSKMKNAAFPVQENLCRALIIAACRLRDRRFFDLDISEQHPIRIFASKTHEP